MKKTKVVLNQQNLGLIFDRLSRFMKAGIALKQVHRNTEGIAFKKINFEKYTPVFCSYNTPPEIIAGGIIFRHFRDNDLLFTFNTVFHFGKDEMVVQISSKMTTRYKIFRSPSMELESQFENDETNENADNPIVKMLENSPSRRFRRRVMQFINDEGDW